MLLEIQQGNISEKLSNGEVRHLRKYGEVELLRKFADEILREIRQHVGENHRRSCWSCGCGKESGIVQVECWY